MQQLYQTGRLLSAVAFLFFTAGALAILFADVVQRGAPLELKHFITIVILAGTIFAGHLHHKARGLSRWGFVLLFLAGTFLVVCSSVGRQGEQMTISAAEAEAAAESRVSAKQRMARAQAMLGEAQSALANECKSGGGKRCKGIERTIDVYTAAISGEQATLSRLGQPKPVAAEAEKLAEVAALFGADHGKVKAAVLITEPFAKTLFLEWGAIITLGFALRGSQKQKGLQPKPQPLDETPHLVAPVSIRDSQQSSFPVAVNGEASSLVNPPGQWKYGRFRLN